MDLDTVIKRVKYLLFIFSLIFLLLATIVFFITLWLRFSNETQAIFKMKGYGSTFYTGVHVLIFAALLMMGVAFLGCCGAIRESQWMLVLYFLCLLVIFIVVIAAGIWGSSKRDQVLTELQTFYRNSHAQYLETGEESVRKTLIVVHYIIGCCGLTGVMDEALSRTCQAPGGTRSVKSCPPAIDEFVNSKFRSVMAFLALIGIVVAICMILSMVLCCAIWRSMERMSTTMVPYELPDLCSHMQFL